MNISNSKLGNTHGAGNKNKITSEETKQKLSLKMKEVWATKRGT